MAWSQDDTESFTITLTAFLEGKGIIRAILVSNRTQVITYAWDNGSWITPLPQAVEGDTIIVIIHILNDGDASDILFAEFVSDDVIVAQPLVESSSEILNDGLDYLECNWEFTMPPKNVDITLNAGHVEPD